MSDRPVRLLLIDDSKMDGTLERIMLEKVFYSLKVDTCTEEPSPLNGVLGYDGVILDERLDCGRSGMDIARRIHELDWRLPVMVVSGSVRLPPTAYLYVDYIADKNDTMALIHMATAFVRQVARLKNLKEESEL